MQTIISLHWKPICRWYKRKILLGTFYMQYAGIWTNQVDRGRALYESREHTTYMHINMKLKLGNYQCETVTCALDVWKLTGTAFDNKNCIPDYWSHKLTQHLPAEICPDSRSKAKHELLLSSSEVQMKIIIETYLIITNRWPRSSKAVPRWPPISHTIMISSKLAENRRLRSESHARLRRLPVSWNTQHI